MQSKNDMNQTLKDFVPGRPTLVCRWRLSDHALPLENRHLRALSQRTVNGAKVSDQLLAWAKQHIEWTLKDGSQEYPDGVLMLILDDKGQATMSVGPYEPLEDATPAALVARAREAAQEATETGVAPETLWAVQNGQLIQATAPSEKPSGLTTLIYDLCATRGHTIERRVNLIKDIAADTSQFDEVFLTSDEHGIVAAQGASGACAQQLSADYRKLLGS